METVDIHSILITMGERIDFLIKEGRNDDAISICEEFVEWIGQLMT